MWQSRTSRRVRSIRALHTVAVLVAVTGLLVAALPSEEAHGGFLEEATFVAQWGTNGTGIGQFSNPQGIAVDGSGNVYVADRNNHRVQKFDSSGVYNTQWGSNGSGDGQFSFPSGLAVDGSSSVYVTDANQRVQKFTSAGVFVTKWGSSGNGDGQFISPWGVTVDGDGDVYVADNGNRRIQKFTSAGVFVDKWGTDGSADGQFISPRDVAVDADGIVYVVDNSAHRVQGFTPAGAFFTKWGRLGSGAGQFEAPSAIEVGGDGTVYVADTTNDRIQKFLPPPALFTLAQVGIGTDSPAADLEVTGDDGATQVLVTETSAATAARSLLALVNNGPAGISLTNTDSGETWDLTGGGSFRIGDTATTPLHIETGAPTDSLALTPTGVGIGTASPAEPLHVVRDDGTARMLVQETTAVRARRFLMNLENNGPTGMQFTNTETGVMWEFATAGADNFSISLAGTGGNEFSLRPSGRLLIGPGSLHVFDLKPNGNLTVAGTITDGNGTTLEGLAAENQALRDRIAELQAQLDGMADLEARISALEVLLAN